MTPAKSAPDLLAQFTAQIARNPHTLAALRDAMENAERRAQISVRIRELRERRGFTQPQVADRIGAQLRTYQKWEGGGGTSGENYERLAEVFGVSYDYLVMGRESEPVPEDILGRLDEIREEMGTLGEQQQEMLKRLNSLDARLRAADMARRAREDREQSPTGRRETAGR
jgi:transcriptional regulator with XRE-family HTH domain